MKKIFGTIVVILLWMNGVIAQDNYLDMRLGAGIPNGDFAETGSDSVGSAGTGFTMSFEGNYFFLGKLGVVGSLTYGMNFLDDVSLQEYLEGRLQGLFPGVELPEEAVRQFTSQQWNNVNAMVGPVLSLPFSSLKLELRGLVGVSFIMPPEWDLYLAWDENQFYATSSGQSVRFAWMAGAGLLYQQSGGYGLRLGFDYFQSSTQYDTNYKYERGNAGETPFTTIPLSVPVSMFQATVGILYAF
jgi:hypothetical protein